MGINEQTLLSGATVITGLINAAIVTLSGYVLLAAFRFSATARRGASSAVGPAPRATSASAGVRDQGESL